MIAMAPKLIHFVSAVLALEIIGAAKLMCPSDPNCVCGGTLAVELDCNIDGHLVKINLLPGIYINIKCENTSSLDYARLPRCANNMSSFKSVSFKDCPLPKSSFKEVLTNMGVSKTMALIFQNARNLSGYFDRKHFAGLQDLTKLLLSINGVTHLPNNLFMDISKLTWLNIRSNSINLSEELFKPLERLETLEISHNHMTNISSNLFSHLSFLRKLSLWQSNVTWFSNDLFSGVDVLEELDLSSNGLNELPASIFKPLKKLKKLTLFSNKFLSLPEKLFKNNYYLETVVFLNNDVKLRDLPKNLFGNLPKLKQIYFQRSGLENIPYDVFINSSQITDISLAHNDIKQLPESIFNDQINLLELDMSYNRLTKLDPRLFSSLVRLEKLDLSYNELVLISGKTFSSLLSLIYLNMEHNNLERISSYLFSNNKQRMSISFAYNRLTFEERKIINKTCKVVIRRYSPFIYTYNLHLLNLSHNHFKFTSKDWWVNGHEKLDISGNCISNLWGDEFYDEDYEDSIKKPFHGVWISQNPIDCTCRNRGFVNFLLKNPVTKMPDLDDINCSGWPRDVCNSNIVLGITIVLVVLVLYAVIFIFITTNSHIKLEIKKFIEQCRFSNRHTIINVIVKYSDVDEELVLKNVLPALTTYQNLKIQTRPPKYLKITESVDNHDANQYTDQHKTLIVFSPNYLISTYSHVDIKKIHIDMMEAINTLYVFVDGSSENSVYAFLKNQRDLRTSFVWNEPNLWDKVVKKLREPCIDEDYDSEIGRQDVKKMNITFSNLPDPNIYEFKIEVNNEKV